MSVITKIQQLTRHQYVSLTTRGNTAIDAAVRLSTKDVLIPQEGAWIHYQKSIKNAKKKNRFVASQDAKILLPDLKEKLKSEKYSLFLYQNPGGYFATQQMKEIYKMCLKHDCLVVLDVSGSIGTPLCDGRFADIIVGSFGKWKLAPAGSGGFISFSDEFLSEEIEVEELDDDELIKDVDKSIDEIPDRIEFLEKIRVKICDDLNTFEIISSSSHGLVVIVAFNDESEKERIIKYCEDNQYPYTECPRTIRVNRSAISIEIKRLINEKKIST